MKKYLLIICIYMVIFGLSSLLATTEPWIDYDSMSKIELGSNKEDVISSLGEPVLMLGSSEYDNTVHLFYNYHVKSYNTKHGSLDNKKRHVDKERTTLIKFTFIEKHIIH